MYTIKAYVIRVYATDYRPWDLGIDALILEQLCYLLMYFYYIFGMEGKSFIWKEFLWGCAVSIFFLIGKQTLCVAYAEGPGGPVNAIIITQSLYQVILDFFIDH